MIQILLTKPVRHISEKMKACVAVSLRWSHTGNAHDAQSILVLFLLGECLAHSTSGILAACTDADYALMYTSCVPTPEGRYVRNRVF